ncbi:sigma-70 family RNA polymerase sigma factor [Pseudoalteromonas sp. MMG010]|uniref:ECF-type sigma factor n=1 Tax=Pseudoalteromonas sp. MMG010 TaxID=2822685 RepID=UPI001B3A09C4|nr:ECF-type sigma factor [Pseudoalteromonas sp. MMG010]MBQ4834304.1 sigma-70 family RNA polymerase sigma factor [Pseudoalteromonas sp. MMG010]
MQHDMTQAIIDWQQGEAASQENMYLIIYDQLRTLASSQRRKVAQKFGEQTIEEHINSTTAIVHEVYIKLEHANNEQFSNRKEFFLMIARTIHNILVDQARKNAAQKRQVELTVLDERIDDDINMAVFEQSQQMIDLGNALQLMETQFPRQAQSMQLKYFGGLLVKEISALLAISISSAEKDIAFAKSWLKLRLSE